jgi:hypothetical protein
MRHAAEHRMRGESPGGWARILIVLAAAVGVLALGGCSGDSTDPGALTAKERKTAQSALDSLQDSNISLQLVAITRWVQSPPAACRTRLVSRSPRKLEVYVFWIPWLAASPYVWLNMNVTDDPHTSTFHLGTAQPVLPGGRLNRDGRTINRGSVDTTLLSRYGAPQARKSRQMLRAHGGDVFVGPGAPCQLLQNGSIRLVSKS